MAQAIASAFGIASVPGDLGIGGREDADDATGRAPEVEGVGDPGRHLDAGAGEGAGDHVGLIKAAGGREGSAGHRVNLVRRLGTEEAGAVEQPGNGEPDPEREEEVATVGEVGVGVGVEVMGELRPPADRPLDLGDLLGDEAVVEDLAGFVGLDGELAGGEIPGEPGGLRWRGIGVVGRAVGSRAVASAGGERVFGGAECPDGRLLDEPTEPPSSLERAHRLLLV